MGNENDRNIKDTYCKVTSFNDLKKYSEGEIVYLPDFTMNQPLIVKMKRPSIGDLISTGKIPNTLLSAAQALFEGEVDEMLKENKMKDFVDTMIILAKASLIEPTYDDIINAGMKLTDKQLLAIYTYSQLGSEALIPFRPKQE